MLVSSLEAMAVLLAEAGGELRRWLLTPHQPASVIRAFGEEGGRQEEGKLEKAKQEERERQEGGERESRHDLEDTQSLGEVSKCVWVCVCVRVCVRACVCLCVSASTTSPETSTCEVPSDVSLKFQLTLCTIMAS